MNKYCIQDFCNDLLKDNVSTLKETSYDCSHNEHLCNDEVTENVYNFDGYVACNFDATTLPASPDAIVVGNKKLYFVEFKNQTPPNIDNRNIKNKFISGTGILKNILEEFKPTDIELVFCLVHKEHNVGNAHFDYSHITSMSDRFSLEKLNKDMDSFYDHIIAGSVDFYKSQFFDLRC